MKRRESKKFEYNSLHWYATKLFDSITKREELEEMDMTEIFYAELDTMVERGEIIIIQCNAKMRLGKSTLILALADFIWNLLIQYGHRKRTERFGVRNIAMDQMEFDYKMRDPETTFTVIATDEENESEETGQDISTIKALQRDQSNIQADRYVHRVNACPTGLIDPNTDIILDITSKDEKEQIIRANITYRWYDELSEKTQLLGYVLIPVGHIISNWVKYVKPKFYEKLRAEAEFSRLMKRKKDGEVSTKEEIELGKKIKKLNRFIKSWEKKDWYVAYYMKKRKKIELVTKYKITKPRILRYAPVIIRVIERFELMCKYTSLVKKEMVKNNIKLEMKKAGMPQSIVGEELTTNEVMGVLDGYKSFWTITKEMEISKQKYIKGKIPVKLYKEKMQELSKVRQQIKENIKLQIDEYQRAMDVLNEYDTEFPEEYTEV